MELVFRFFIGGCIVSIFAVIAEVLKPKGFAGLFAAAPSVALATLGLYCGERRQAVCRSRSKVHDRRGGGLPALCDLLCLFLGSEAHQDRPDHVRAARGLGHRRLRSLVVLAAIDGHGN
jgi:hypothetical protein